MQANNIHYRFALRIAISASLLYYSTVISFNPSRFLYDPDTFWHIRTGAVDFRSCASSDGRFLFLHCEREIRGFPLEWLSEIFFAVAYRYGGWRGCSNFSCDWLAPRLSEHCASTWYGTFRFSIAIGWTALTSAAISTHFLARPHIFSFVLLAIWIVDLIDAYDNDDFSLRSWFTLTSLMVLWANLHGSFTFGLAVALWFLRELHRPKYYAE